ncbi:MAG: hypothetical protein KDK03_17660 [Rhodobacteraceae bacterium]|uniref:hypothetical protein n=1 Tax=Amaricoccus sp. B4 TaxID=3368557 RepID=UPI000DACBFFD|nr:hypothetical protein [Paracoccaceae bacterium]
MQQLTVLSLAFAGVLLVAACSESGAAKMSPAEREEFADDFTRMDPLATGEIPSAAGGQLP